MFYVLEICFKFIEYIVYAIYHYFIFFSPMDF